MWISAEWKYGSNQSDNQQTGPFFDYVVENLDSASRGLIKMPIGYGDDMRNLTLQAADMLAWHIRR